MRRFKEVCPIQQKLEQKLQQVGESTLDVKAGGKLPACGVEPAIPENPALDEALTFFADFPDESEQLLYRSAKITNEMVTSQYSQVKKSLSTVPVVPPTKIEAFFAGKICGAESITTRQKMKEAVDCKSPSEIPEGEKVQLIQNILQKHLVEFDKTQDFDKLVKETQTAMGEMEKLAKQAEEGTLPVPQAV